MIRSLTLILTIERNGVTDTRTETSPLTLLAVTEAARCMIAGSPTASGWRIVALRCSS